MFAVVLPINACLLHIIVDVVEVSRSDCKKALDLDMNDYEDALLSQYAKRSKATYIITRNTKRFIDSPVEAITPDDFLKRLAYSRTSGI